VPGLGLVVDIMTMESESPTEEVRQVLYEKFRLHFKFGLQVEAMDDEIIRVKHEDMVLVTEIEIVVMIMTADDM
jgi:hypothetical protein